MQEQFEDDNQTSDTDSDSSEKLIIAARKLNKLENEKYAYFTEEEISVIKDCKDTNLKNALLLNRKKKYSLLKIENSLKYHLKQVREKLVQLRTASTEVSAHKRRRHCLGMPYFKDKELYGCPYNEDYENMKRNKELPLQQYYIPRIWTLADKKKLALAVFTRVCDMKRTELVKQIEINKKKFNYVENEKTMRLVENQILLLGKTDFITNLAVNWNSAVCFTDKELEDYKYEIQSLISYKQNELETIFSDNYSHNEINVMKQKLNDLESKNYIVQTVAFWDKKIDWLDIAVNDMQERHPDIQCKFMWHEYMNPKNSKKSWTDEENTRLTFIVQKYNRENWELIAQELNNKKTAYQCCVHFFSKLNEKFKREKWSKEEQKFLLNIIEVCRTGNYIPWGRVSKFFQSRDKHQVYNHYTYCMHSEKKKGKFSLAEDILLKSLVKYHKSFSKASYYFPDRTIVQLRDRFKLLQTKNLNSFTFEDDIEILRHVSAYGDCYWKFVKVNKNPHSIRHRYNTLQKWIAANPGKSIEHVIRRTRSSKVMKIEKTKLILTNSIMEILEEKLSNGEKPEIVFNLSLIQKLINLSGLSKKESTQQRPQKPKEFTSINNCILDFFKPCYKFVGRKKLLNDEVIDDGVKVVKFLLETLKANINIPNEEELLNNPLLDEFDVSILLGLSNASRDDSLPSTSQSTNETINNIPPEPMTLIGFRGLMLHMPILKEHSNGNYQKINSFLPKNALFDTRDEGYSKTKLMITEQTSRMSPTEQVKILEERNLCKKRFTSIFKWPALMSMPYNSPPENPFIKELSDNETSQSDKMKTNTTNTKSIASSSKDDPVLSVNEIINTEGTRLQVIAKKPFKRNKGRPKKLTGKVLLMLERKKQQFIHSQENIEDVKPTTGSNNYGNSTDTVICNSNIKSESFNTISDTVLNSKGTNEIVTSNYANKTYSNTKIEIITSNENIELLPNCNITKMETNVSSKVNTGIIISSNMEAVGNCSTTLKLETNATELKYVEKHEQNRKREINDQENNENYVSKKVCLENRSTSSSTDSS